MTKMPTTKRTKTDDTPSACGIKRLSAKANSATQKMRK